MFRRNPWHTGNPTTLTMASPAWTAAGGFQFEVRGLDGMNCEVQASHDFWSWTDLGTVVLSGGMAVVADETADEFARRFYRAHSDSILSHDALGYYDIEMPAAGTYLIANQLNHPSGQNTLNNILPDVPVNSGLTTWNAALQAYDSQDKFYGLAAGGWLDSSFNPITTELNPGSGALLQVPSHSRCGRGVNLLFQRTIDQNLETGVLRVAVVKR